MGFTRLLTSSGAVLVIGCGLGLPDQLRAQQQQSGSNPANMPIRLPASGRSQQAGSAEAKQTTSQSGPAVVNPSITVTGNYQGSVNGPETSAGPIRLSIGDAVRRGLKTNLGAVAAGTALSAASAQRLQYFSQLLPQVTASISETETQINLAKSGLSSLANGSSSVNIPLIVGPFHYFDAQGNVNWNAFSLTAIRNHRSARAAERAASLSDRDARETVVFAVGGTYLQVIAAAARIEAEKTQVQYAQASYNQAKAQLAAGTNLLVDVKKALVQFQSEQERLISLQGDYEQQKLGFARLIGLRQDAEIVFTQALAENPGGKPDDMGMLRLAFDRRSDLKAAGEQVRAAEHAVASARGERMPTVSLNGFYGADGPNPGMSHGVFTATLGVNIPIFDGGKIRSDVENSLATLQQRKAEYEDTKSKVEQDVRVALIQLKTSLGQVDLAKSNRQYATEALTQSQDRYAAGVTTSVEVVQSQQQLGAAENDYVSSLFAVNLARLTLARAVGSAEADLDSIFAAPK